MYIQDIKFRGRRLDNNEWVYGYLVVDPQGGCRIYWKPFDDATSNTYHLVNPETVGQYIGKQDKNGKDMYYGDIVHFARKKKICPVCSQKEISEELTYSISKFCPECGTPVTDGDFITTGKIAFDNCGFAYEYDCSEICFSSWHIHASAIYIEWVEVIGNIYETPELLPTTVAA